MPETKKKIACPKCAHEFDVALDADITHLTCPHCEAEIPEESFRALAKAADELAPGFKAGQRLGNYVVESLLGSGGMAVVLRGRQLSLNRNVAIKILPTELAKNKFFVARFESEAAVLANLNHPNIVSVIDRGREGDTCFIVMEYVEGETLKTRMRRQGLFSPTQVFAITLQVLAGLEYAHRRGVIHRDIKPGNIMINREEMVKIADFGLAHLAKEQGGMDVTRVGQAMGTLTYMAPEQLTNAKNIDARADLYSVGVCLYEMLTGRLPLGTFKMPSECDSKADVRWDEIILRTLKMDSEERYSSAEEMAQALREMAATPGMTLAQKEREEEAEIPANAGGSLTACANCGRESKPSARQCEQCGASLADLFDACPSCKTENRVDVARCPGCGADLGANRDQMRRKAEAIQAKAKQLASERNFDQALAQLKKLERFRTREYASVRERARLWIERIKRRQERFYQRTYEAGQRLIAERRAEQALELWAVLPEGYRDVATRRKDIAAKVPAADAAVAEGDRLYGLGDLAGAIAAWEKAAAFRPHDPELRKRLAGARVRLGNLNLKRSYMKESEQAAARGDFIEALALCRKVLDLDPTDKTALTVEKELEAKKREFAQKEVESAPKVIVPRLRPKRSSLKWPTPRRIALIAGVVGLLALVAWIVFVAVPESRRVAEETAARLLRDANDLKSKGSVAAALAQCRRIETKYSGTSAAEGASDLAIELRALEADAYARYFEAEALADGKNLRSSIAAFRKFEELLKGPPVTAVDVYRVRAKKRLEDLREEIAMTEAQIGAEYEKKGEWHEALDRYRAAAEEYGFNHEPITSKLNRARKRLDDCTDQLNAGRLAAQAGKWDEACRDAMAALDLVPTNLDANKLLADIAPKLTPPTGMVLIPAGKYIVGGSEGNPQRTVEVPRGFFIDAVAVSHERFAEFLRATQRAPPPGWDDGELPPPNAAQLPVVNVTWEDAAAFAAWDDRTLPTEEQWECACRGQSGQPYPWGEAWDASAAVLGFGPAPVGSAAKDRSPFGCMDMAGNVAEWTATDLVTTSVPPGGGTPASPGSGDVVPRRLSLDGRGFAGGRRSSPLRSPGGVPPRRSPAAGPTSAAAAPAKPVLYVVKGSSWAGLEKDRPTTVVADSLPGGAGDSAVMLSPDSKSREWALRFPSNIEMQYKGLVGELASGDDYVLVRRWMPTWDQWAEFKFQVPLGHTIGGPADVVMEEARKRKTVQVDFSTGCIAVRHEPKVCLEFRDPAGVLRTMPYIVVGVPRMARVREYKELPPEPEMSLQQAASAFARMVGWSNRRYVNVGFRCVKMLWTQPPVAEAE